MGLFIKTRMLGPNKLGWLRGPYLAAKIVDFGKNKAVKVASRKWSA